MTKKKKKQTYETDKQTADRWTRQARSEIGTSKILKVEFTCSSSLLRHLDVANHTERGNTAYKREG